MANDNYVIAIDGLETLDDLSKLPEAILRKARMAISKTTDRARTLTSAEIRKQVAFSASYLTGSDGKLTAQKDLENLRGSIRAKFRPTSLARFAKSKSVNTPGVTVQVSPTKTVRIPKAFLVKLPQGAVQTETQFNLGLAVRLKPDELLKFKKSQWAKLGKGLYLLYGPSVSQVFESVADQNSPEIARYLETEFTRLIQADF